MNDKGRVAGLIAVLIVGLFVVVTIGLFVRVIPQANVSAFNGLVTALVGMVSGIIGYFFGSSRTAERAQSHIETVTTPSPDTKKS